MTLENVTHPEILMYGDLAAPVRAVGKAHEIISSAHKFAVSLANEHDEKQKVGGTIEITSEPPEFTVDEAHQAEQILIQLRRALEEAQWRMGELGIGLARRYREFATFERPHVVLDGLGDHNFRFEFHGAGGAQVTWPSSSGADTTVGPLERPPAGNVS